MPLRLIDLYHADLADQTTTEARQYVRRYWYRAIGLTITERSITPVSIPKRGTHGVRTERFAPFWRQLPDDEIYEVFFVLKPYFNLKEHRDTDLS